MCCSIYKSGQGCTRGSRNGFGRQMLAASIHMCVAEYINSGMVKAWPTMCCYEDTHVGQQLQRLGRPIAAVSTYTHVCFRTSQCRLHPKIKGYNGVADHVLPSAYTSVQQNKINSGLHPRIRGSRGTRVWPTTCCCEHTHIHTRTNACGRISQLRAAHKDQRPYRFCRPVVAVSTRMSFAE